jgi:hypothetical protein
MQVKYTKQFLNRLEDLMSETDYILRYEKGNFQSGYCILKDTKVAIINKYYSIDGKINSLIEIIRSIELDTAKFSEKNTKLFKEITQTELQF